MNVKPAVKITVEEYEKLLRLKELNREMVKGFYRIIDLTWHGETGWEDGYIRECCKVMIAKAEGEG